MASGRALNPRPAADGGKCLHRLSYRLPCHATESKPYISRGQESRDREKDTPLVFAEKPPSDVALDNPANALTEELRESLGARIFSLTTPITISSRE